MANEFADYRSRQAIPDFRRRKIHKKTLPFLFSVIFSLSNKNESQENLTFILFQKTNFYEAVESVAKESETGTFGSVSAAGTASVESVSRICVCAFAEESATGCGSSTVSPFKIVSSISAACKNSFESEQPLVLELNGF